MTALTALNQISEPAKRAQPPIPPSSDWSSYIGQKLQEVGKTHKVFLAAIVMVTTLTVIYTPVEKEWLKFLFINGLAVLVKEKSICRIGVNDGVSIGYLTRGLHDLALSLLGDLSSLPSGIFWTLWAMNIKDYG